MKPWDKIPWMPQPPPPTSSATWSYKIPKGRIGRLYELNIVYVNGSQAGTRRFHIEMGTAMFPYKNDEDNDNFFKFNLPAYGTATMRLTEDIEVFQTSSSPYQTHPLPKDFEIVGDYYWGPKVVTYYPITGDTLRVYWKYKEQDWR